eukprot:142751_1
MISLKRNNKTIDMVHPLSSNQRIEMLISGYMERAQNILQSQIPYDIIALCNKYIDKTTMQIQSNTEIAEKKHEEKKWKDWQLKRHDNMKSDINKLHKVVILGAGAVGKTAITIRLIDDEWRPHDYDPMWNDYQHFLDVWGHKESLNILDTAGQQQFAAIQHHWIREGDVFLLVYAINSQRTFRYVNEVYRNIIRNKDDEPFTLVLIGNKVDLPADRREIPYDYGVKLAKQWNVSFFETSAKTGANVVNAFTTVIQEAIKLEYKMENEKNIEIGIQKKSACCHLL